MALTIDQAKETKKVSIYLASLSTEMKNNALVAIAKALTEHKETILAANEKDMEFSRQQNLAEPLLKRLLFDEKKINSVVEGIYSLIRLPDPVGVTLSATELTDGLELFKVSCPIGVIGVIFESRPDALVQISTLCLKSGNAVLLKGGSEAMHTNRVLFEIIAQATEKANIPSGWIQLLESRADVNEMLKMDEYIDLIIPRGSNEFVKYIMDHSNIPVLGHADGICHVYIDAQADIPMALKVAVDSKTQYVAVCNAAETLLIHKDIAPKFLPLLKEALDKFPVELRGCERTQQIIPVTPANEQDWTTEYLDYIWSIRIVDNVQNAVEHINRYGSGHTESIITTDALTAKYFMDHCDSGNVFWNASTRFSDGYRYGLGAEVGISTNKIHARGPVGLEGLVIYKWKLIGNGHIVNDFATGKLKFSHKSLSKNCPL